jgi:hypothetical protein
MMYGQCGPVFGPDVPFWTYDVEKTISISIIYIYVCVCVCGFHLGCIFLSV